MQVWILLPQAVPQSLAVPQGSASIYRNNFNIIISHDLRLNPSKERTMKHTEWLADLQQHVSDLIARSPAADIERNVKAFMAQAFTRMDLVTREEFDVQADLLARLRERVDTLEARVCTLEARLADADASAVKVSPATSLPPSA